MPTPDPIFVMRFFGDRLDRSNLPIYELGRVFVSVQRLFHKAYLAENERLEKGAFPSKEERRKLALQVGLHEKGSDLYGLVPFLSDPAALASIKDIAGMVLSGLASYAWEKVLDSLRGRETKQNIYIGSIHAEIVNIVDRIDGVSGCEAIQIGCPQLGARPVDLTTKTRDYTHRVAGERYLGSVQQMHGDAYKLYPNFLMIEIRKRPGGKKCKLFLTQRDFDKVRYGQIRSPLLSVTGRPRFRIGTERRSFDEFEVTRIDSIDDAEN